MHQYQRSPFHLGLRKINRLSSFQTRDQAFHRNICHSYLSVSIVYLLIPTNVVPGWVSLSANRLSRPTMAKSRLILSLEKGQNSLSNCLPSQGTLPKKGLPCLS